MTKLEELKKLEKEIQAEIQVKMLSIGKADSPMESRYPSARFELENSIELLEIQLQSVRAEIRNISPKS